ncbi:sigma-70 family RNA polymerase sigma factor [Brevibacillus aydinogluensis]|jgi:RNA polymerase sigma-70 factor, ECF subfamily|uniref:RNA polymerase n=1 Tax=Brevibacillus aydinogluensis TaxID=927786 RepID=A0AA48MFN7_9BACL|nr:sigma-70 family RNA polymerase sigma factor [Brevibacillus aydinogluensis]CAJ1004671.1 RNA polymerase [Brevibacillus aydinogluensis]
MDVVAFVKQAQSGNDAAYLALFQQYEEMVYRIAFVYVKNQDDALDIVQEVAYRSFKSIKTLREPRYFKTWLTKITISCSINVLQKRRKVIQMKPEQLDDVRSMDEDLPLSITLKDVLEKLDVNEKSVILLRFYQDYTIKEIAQVLELPLGTIKTILYRSLGKLRGILQEVESS